MSTAVLGISGAGSIVQHPRAQ